MVHDTRNILVQYVGKMCAVIRALILVFTLAIAVMILGIGRMILKNHVRFSFALKSLWCRFAFFILGIKVKVEGETSQEAPFLCISNHVNFIDPLFFLAYLDVRPVGKHEISRYPLIGFTGRMIGMLFVDRGNDKSRSTTKNAIESALAQGDNILIFPEGTVSLEHSILPFKRGSFHAVKVADAEVLICSLDFKHEQRYRWHERSLISQFFYQFSFLSTEVTVKIHNRMKINDINEDIKHMRTIMGE